MGGPPGDLMSLLTETVSLTITQESVGLARAGFGIPLIVSHSASWVERVRTYESASDVQADFATTTPEYLSAAAIFAQSPHPEEIMIGRAALKPTQTFVIGVAQVLSNTKYAVNVVAPGATVANPYTYTSDGSATNDEIVGGLVALLNGIVGKNFTAAATGSVGSQVCTVTGNAPGNWFSIQVVDVSLLSNKLTHADPGVATDLAAILNENGDWYALHTTFNSKAYVLAVASWIESNGKLYLVDVPETDAITVPVGSGTDTLAALFALTYNRTAGSYHPDSSQMFSAAWLGRVLPDQPGSETWKFKTLSGITGVALTTTHRTNLKARKANSYSTFGGQNKTWEGTVAGGTYGYIDVTRGYDFMFDTIEKHLADALDASEKIPITDPGIAIVRAELTAGLKVCATAGIINDDFEITVPKAKDISSADKAARRLTGVKFTATLQGAIHSIAITGSVSVTG
jgi:hypothetical protein